jgi:Fe-S-cluster containining protein
MECDQCGFCCRQYPGTNWARSSDMVRWYDEGRTDILRYVAIRTRDGRQIHADSLSRAELESLDPVHGWTDPLTGRDLPLCPFLHHAKDGKYYCQIHATKPLTCRNFVHQDWETFAAYRQGFDPPE